MTDHLFCTDGYQQAIRDAVDCIERSLTVGEQEAALDGGAAPSVVSAQVSLRKFIALRVADLAKPTLHGLLDWPIVSCDACSQKVQLCVDKCPSGMCGLPKVAAPATGAQRSTSTSGWLQAVPAPGPTTLQWEDEPAAAKARCDAQDALYAKARAEWHDIGRANGFKRPDEWFLIGVEWAATQTPMRPFEFEGNRRPSELVDKSADLHGKPVDEIAELHPSANADRLLHELVACKDLKAAIDRGLGETHEVERNRAWHRAHEEYYRRRDSAWAAARAYLDAPKAAPSTIADCIAQLDVWNGHLEAAIDREAHENLGQHANDAPSADGPLEHLP